jgi:hypothetical protein
LKDVREVRDLTAPLHPVEKTIKKRCGEEDEKVISMTNLLEIKKASTNVKALYFKDKISDLNA